MSTLQDLAVLTFHLHLRKLENNVRTTVSRVAIKMAFLLLPGFNGDLSQVSGLQNGDQKTVLAVSSSSSTSSRASGGGGGGQGVNLGTGDQHSRSQK